MKLSRKKVIAMVRKRIIEMEAAFKDRALEWNDEVVEFYKNEVHNAEKELAEKKAKLSQVLKPSYNHELDEDFAYYLRKTEPKELPEMHQRLKELVEVLEAATEDDIKVSPQIERALGLKW